MEENVYYSPETWGLSVVAEIEYSSGSYEFDTRVIWTDNNGNFYTARDSGCSCPTPFEDFNSISDLETFDFDRLHDEVMYEVQGSSYVSMEEGQNFLRNVYNVWRDSKK